MPSRLHAHTLRGALIASAFNSLAAFGGSATQPGATITGAAAATTVQAPLDSTIARRIAPPAAQAPAVQAPAKPAWVFPAPRTGNPPAETWLPHPLSEDDKAHRLEEDRALMAANRADANDIPNAGILQDELKDGLYDEMESQLDAVLAKFLADPAYELVLQSSANFAEQAHAKGSVSDKALIEAWVKVRPKSAWAHYSAGLRWSATAWDDRGGGWAGDISDEQWKKVHVDEVQARAEIEAALKINPKLAIAWITLMDIDRTDTGSGLDQVTADFNRGSKQVPTSYLIANEYMETLEPRWMGSAGMMDDFAQSQLTNVDRNPRFWDLQGDSLADSGCAACNDYQWGVSLKQYNAALAFADRPSWLAAAGEAAMHVHRYALAHAYYERALAYKDDLYWGMFRDFNVTLCDPSKTPEEVERYRQDVVTYGGLENVQYPHGPDDCVVYQRELPWGAEPLAAAAGMKAYSIDPIGHPDYENEPQPVVLSARINSVTSPDGAWVVTLADDGDKTYRLELHGPAPGKTVDINKYANNVMVGFTSDSKHLFLSDWTQGKEGGCSYVDPSNPAQPVNLKEMIVQWATDHHISVDLETMRVTCSQFANDEILIAALSGQTKGQQVFRMFYYDMVSGALVPLPH